MKLVGIATLFILFAAALTATALLVSAALDPGECVGE